MTQRSRSFLLAAALIAAPLFTVSAQQSTQGGTSSSTPPSATAQDPNAPGATGRAVVPGNRSTVSGDKAGTVETKTNQNSTGASGGGR